MDAKVPRKWMQDAKQVVGAHEIISNCAAHLHARTLNDIGSLFFEGMENLTTEESVGQGYTLYSAGFTLPIALESTAEEALATTLSTTWGLAEALKKIPVAEALKKFPVNEALKKAPLACGYDKPCTRGDVKMKMRLTEEDLGEVSISIDIPPEAIIKIKEAGAHAGLEDWSLADLTSSVMCLGLTLALKHPADFKKIAKKIILR